MQMQYRSEKQGSLEFPCFFNISQDIIKIDIDPIFIV